MLLSKFAMILFFKLLSTTPAPSSVTKLNATSTFQVVVQVVPSPITGCFYAVYIHEIKHKNKDKMMIFKHFEALTDNSVG